MLAIEIFCRHVWQACTGRCIRARLRSFSGNRLRVLGTRTVILRVPHTEDLQLLVAAAVLYLGFMSPYIRVRSVSDLLSVYEACPTDNSFGLLVVCVLIFIFASRKSQLLLMLSMLVL